MATQTTPPGSNGQLLFNDAGVVAAEDPVVSQPTASLLNATVVGTLTNNNAAPGTSGIMALICRANASSPTWTEGDLVLCSEDLSGNLRVTGTITANQGGTWTVQQGGAPWSVSQSGSWTVTANAGTNLNTSALQLDATGAKLNLAQGSTTSGQTGPLIQCAATTSAPTDTTADTWPISCTTAGAVRVDGSAVTQPVSIAATVTVSGTVTANQGGAPWSMIGTLTNNNAAPSTNNLGVLPCLANTSAPTPASGDLNTLSCLPGNGALRADLTSVAGTATSTAASGTQLVGVTGHAGGNFDAATAAAVPANGVYVGGNGSGNLTGLITCDNNAPISMSTATTTQIVAISGTGGRTYICAIGLLTNAANNVALVSGSGTNCASNLAGLAGGTTAATGWNFAANSGLTIGAGVGMLWKTVTTNNEICLVTSAATQLSGSITYTQF